MSVMKGNGNLRDFMDKSLDKSVRFASVFPRSKEDWFGSFCQPAAGSGGRRIPDSADLSEHLLVITAHDCRFLMSDLSKFQSFGSFPITISIPISSRSESDSLGKCRAFSIVIFYAALNI
jgi:hypothetical protein